MKYLFALILILFASFANAAPPDNIQDQAKYNKLIDYVGFEFSYIVLVKQNPRAAGEFKAQCGCTTPDITGCAAPDSAAVSTFLIDKGLSSTKLLFDQIEALKDRFGEFKQDPDNYLDKVFHNTSNSSFNHINEFYSDHNGDVTYEPIINAIGNKISAGFKPDTSRLGAPVSGTKIAAQDAAPAPVHHSFFSFDINITSLLLLIIGLVVLFRLMTGHVGGISVQQTDTDVSSNAKGYIKSKLKEQAKRHEESMALLTDRVDKLNNELNAAKLELKQIKGANAAAEQAPITAERTSETFYLPVPNREGHFDNSAVSPIYKEGVTVFRAVTTSPTTAKFQMDEQSSSISLALSDLSRIEACCKQLNAYNRYTKRIVNTGPGQLELRGEQWQVISKAHIVFEN